MPDRIYADTSVIGGCEDEEFRASSNRRHKLVSWNFTHVVNLPRIHRYHGVNARFGYPTIEIRSPREVVTNE